MDSKKHHTHLSIEERRQIYLLMGRRVPVCQIAEALGRHHSTIYREIQRNGFWDEEEQKNNGLSFAQCLKDPDEQNQQKTTPTALPRS